MMMNNMITRIKSMEIPYSINQASNILQINENEPEQNKFIVKNNICEICRKLKEFYKIKEYVIKNNNNNNILINNQNNVNNLLI